MSIAAILALTLSSCFSDWKGDAGTFSISVGGSVGRTALPWNDDIEIEKLEHIITLEGPGPKQEENVTGAGTVQFSVVPGIWKITVEAYEVKPDGGEEDRGLEAVAVGSKTVDIKSGSNDIITIAMRKPDLVEVEMVWVAGGSFQLGKALGTAANNPDETPVSNVTVSGFYIGKYEVTQAQWEAVMGTTIDQQQTLGVTSSTNNYGKGDDFPIYYVNWYDALAFCNKLSVMAGLTPAYRISNSTNPDVWGTAPGSNNATWDAAEVVGGSTGYRLPTEAQWQYAAKGGNPLADGWVGYAYAGSDNPNDVAWYNVSATHEVGGKVPNGLGIYDMSGNIVEWCWDWRGNYTSEDKTNPTGPSSSGSYRVVHGGGWEHPANRIRIVNRDFAVPPYYRNIDLGFRVARPR